MVGLALMLVPLQFGIGAVPESASPELIALLWLLGGPFLGIEPRGPDPRLRSQPPGGWGARTLL